MTRLSSPRLEAFRACAFLTASLALFAGCTSLEYSPYDRGGVFPDMYRYGFAELLTDPTDRFSRAYRGDTAALHSYFVASLDPTLDGETAETHSYMLLKLLLGTGDTHFANTLRKEDPATRESVGRRIDWFVAKRPHRFPQTRHCYTYRYP